VILWPEVIRSGNGDDGASSWSTGSTVHQDARDYSQALMQTEAYRVSRAGRRKIETLFGEAKHILSLVRLRLRGLSGARDEFLLTATVQNLKRLAAHATRPPPQPMIA
jgi:hypothetical protein